MKESKIRTRTLKRFRFKSDTWDRIDEDAVFDPVVLLQLTVNDYGLVEHK